MLSLRGSSRGNAEAGGWSIFAEDDVGPAVLEFATLVADISTVNSKDGRAGIEPGKGIDDDKENVPAPERGRKRLREVKEDEKAAKRRKMVAAGRFGRSGLEGDGKGLERVEVRIEDPLSVLRSIRTKGRGKAVSRRGQGGSEEEHESHDDTHGSTLWKPEVRILFQGAHVFAGIRQLVEDGVIDGEKMPGWMTGQEGVSTAVVKDGIIRKKDHGI